MQGAEGYYGLFRPLANVSRACGRSGPSRIARDSIRPISPHWRVDVHAPNWDVTTRYDFLRQEHFIRSTWRADDPAHFRARCAGSRRPRERHAVRIFRASWRFGLALLYFELLLLACLWSRSGRAPAARALREIWHVPVWGGVLAALAALSRSFSSCARSPTDGWWFRSRITGRACENLLADEATWFDQAIEAGARSRCRALANEADELVVIGHSGGELPLRPWWRAALRARSELAGGGRNGAADLGIDHAAVALHPPP